MNFIKKVVDGRIDDSVHSQFQKFSRGIFKDRAILKVKKIKDKYTINSSYEFANELVRVMAEKLDVNKILVQGVIISTLDLTNKINFKEKKQFKGVKKYVIEMEFSGKEILTLLNEFPKAFFALSFIVDDRNKLKIKPKAPKSGKPSKGKGNPKADFCKLITNDVEIGKNFIFEKSDFKLAEVKHDFIIEEIVLPKLENQDYLQMREMAKRKGKIVRTSEIDGVESIKEFEFEA